MQQPSLSDSWCGPSMISNDENHRQADFGGPVYETKNQLRLWVGKEEDFFCIMSRVLYRVIQRKVVTFVIIASF